MKLITSRFADRCGLSMTRRARRGTDSALVALLDRLGLTPAVRLRLQRLAEPERKAPAQVVALPSPRDPRERL